MLEPLAPVATQSSAPRSAPRSAPSSAPRSVQSSAQSSSPGSSPGSAQGSAKPLRHHSAFHELLSELNPLQYLPIVGTIYRAVTGDTIPERARLVGGFVASGLIGGPIGLAWNAAELAVEKAIGFDPDALGTRVIASLGLAAGHDAAASAAPLLSAPPPSAPAPPAPAPPAPAPSAPAPAAPITIGQAAVAPGSTAPPVTVLASATPLQGAEALNQRELDRIASLRA